MSTVKITRLAIEALKKQTGTARVTHGVLEVLTSRITPDPTEPTGAGVTRLAAEVVVGGEMADVHLTAFVLEVLMVDDTLAPGAGGGTPAAPTTHTFGYAV